MTSLTELALLRGIVGDLRGIADEVWDARLTEQSSRLLAHARQLEQFINTTAEEIEAETPANA